MIYRTIGLLLLIACTGMAVAHQVGVVHRDLKPANILINDEGLLKVVDFGVAAAAGGNEKDNQLTKTGYVIGSPKYMAPEQILGKKVDHRADIYSTGIIFYEMLTGELPSGSFPPPSECAEVDTRVDKVVTKAMDQSPDRRYQRASAEQAD